MKIEEEGYWKDTGTKPNKITYCTSQKNIHTVANLGVRGHAVVFVTDQCCGGINMQHKTGPV